MMPSACLMKQVGPAISMLLLLSPPPPCLPLKSMHGSWITGRVFGQKRFTEDRTQPRCPSRKKGPGVPVAA